MSMQKIALVNKLITDFPDLSFVRGEDFAWSPDKNTVYFADTQTENFELLLLHELGHAICKHKNYEHDIELLKIDSEAWEVANKYLAPKYNISLNKEYEEEQLDTYRDWVHKRSLCPNCNVNGYQTSDLNYKCPACGATWKANQAKFTHLRRKRIK